MKKDLQSSNWEEVCKALIIVIKFAEPIIMHAVKEPVMNYQVIKKNKLEKKQLYVYINFTKQMLQQYLIVKKERKN